MAKLKTDENLKKTVFVIEDDLFLIKAYQVKFEKEGWNVLVATNGTEALSFLEKNPPDVILLDLMLPAISGFDILEVIKKTNKWKDVPVLVITNLGQPQDIERTKTLGAKEYIVKTSVKINDIVNLIKKYA